MDSIYEDGDPGVDGLGRDYGRLVLRPRADESLPVEPRPNPESRGIRAGWSRPGAVAGELVGIHDAPAVEGIRGGTGYRPLRRGERPLGCSRSGGQPDPSGGGRAPEDRRLRLVFRRAEAPHPDESEEGLSQDIRRLLDPRPERRKAGPDRGELHPVVPAESYVLSRRDARRLRPGEQYLRRGRRGPGHRPADQGRLRRRPQRDLRLRHGGGILHDPRIPMEPRRDINRLLADGPVQSPGLLDD